MRIERHGAASVSRSRRFARLGLLATLAGCTASGPHVVDGWHEVAAPTPGARILVMASVGSELLALGSVPGPQGRAPAAWTTTDAHSWQRLALAPATGYGRQAEFVMAGVAGGHVSAYGLAFGGAHGNPRPTLWTGSVRGLTEHEQPFETFGGPHAISVNGAAARAGSALLVGAWDGASGRYGASVWTSPDGVTWTRNADDPALASAPGEQTSARGAAPTATGFLVVGDTVRAAPGGQRSTALAWRSTGGHAWQRIKLPSSGGASAARAACDATGCVVLGNSTSARQHPQCWTVAADGAVRPARAGPGTGLVEVGQALLRGGEVLAITDVDRIARLDRVSRDCTTWREIVLPTRSRDAAIGALGTELLLATSDADHSRLWLR